MLATVQLSIDSLPSELRHLLGEQLTATGGARLSAKHISTTCETLAITPRELSLALLPVAAGFAYTPISHFHVGAIAWGESGDWYFGANMEFNRQSLGQTIHAEQCAITHAWLSGETGLQAITVNASPCGHCRQFMNETRSAGTLRIHLPGQEYSLQHMLPFAFGPTDLGIRDTLMCPQEAVLPAVAPDSLLELARDAAVRSYAPYSHSYAGAAIQAHDGRTFCGRYTENAAFNPSLPPLQSALVMMRMAGYAPEAMVAAALVEAEKGQISHRAPSEALLQAYGVDPLRYAAL